MESIKAYLDAISTYFKKLSKFSLSLIGLVSVVFIGVLDYLTGYEIQFTFFYLIPVSMVTWFAGKRSGVSISIASALAIYAANSVAGKEFSTPLIFLWDIFITLGLFFVVVFSLSALENALGRYRTLIETSPDPIVMYSLSGKMLTANAQAAKVYGVSSVAELFREVKTVFDLLPEEGKVSAADNFRRTLTEGQSQRNEYLIRVHDGRLIPVEINSSVVRTVTGEPQAFISVIRDITERRRVEAEKRSLEERLQRAEKMEAIGTLAGGVAHDLNNVLGIIVGYAEMLLMDAEKSSPIRPRVVHIMSAGQRAAAIVQDLLTLARRGVPGREVLNLNEIIADCQKIPEFEKLLSHHPSVKIKTELEPNLLNVSGSSVHLGKTLFNLVSNASEAMPKGGIVTIKTANQYLEKPIHGYDEIREGDYVVLSVSDTGEGILAADLEHIFEPFYTKKVMGRSGTGLGLTVVWGTVKDHNGYINVESEERKGSTFTLYFPATREDMPAEAAAISISEYMGKGESILIVDDVEGQRDLAAGMLRKLNYNVASVSSGEEAIAFLKEHKIDLILLDMIMDPGMDGLETYSGILKIHPKQKAIIVSGFSESDRVHATQALGAGAYVRKPYIIEKLGLAVKKELNRR